MDETLFLVLYLSLSSPYLSPKWWGIYLQKISIRIRVRGWKWRGSRAAGALQSGKQQPHHEGRWERGQTSPPSTSPSADLCVHWAAAQIIKPGDR